jgi:hypothetical protein
MPDRRVRLEPVTKHNLEAVYDLKVAEGQDEFVASNRGRSPRRSRRPTSPGLAPWWRGTRWSAS